MFNINLPKSKSITGKAKVRINKPICEVFNFVGEHFFENYPKWALEVIEFEPLDGLDMAVGAKAKQKRYEQGQELETILKVTQFEPCKQLSLEAVNGEFKQSYHLESLSESEPTELNFSFQLLNLDLFMMPFEKLIRTAIEEGAQNTVENIKNLIFYEYNNKTIA